MKAELVPAMGVWGVWAAWLAGQHSAFLAEVLPQKSVPLPVPFILDPAAGGTVGTDLPGWGKGEEMGDVAYEGLMQKDFYPVA